MASPGTTPVKGRWRQMARRASTLLPTAISRPTTPAASVRDPDATSLKGSANDSSTSLPLASPPLPALSPAAPAFSQPSPIAESPAREYAALQEAVLSAQPSPLVQSQVVAPEETRAPGPSKLIDSSAVGPGGYTDGYETLPQPTVAKPAPQAEPTPEPTTAPKVADSSAVGPGGFSGGLDELPKPVVVANDPVSPQSEIASPTGYIPPPLIDSSAVGPGGFSDGVDDLPQGEVSVDPFQPQQGRAPVYDEPTALPAAEPVVVAPAAPQPVFVAPSAPQPVAVAPAPPQPFVSRAAPETATPLPQRSDAFFESPVNDEPLELEEENPVAPTRSVDVFGPVAAPTAPTAPTAPITASPQPQATRQLAQPETRAIPTQVAAVVVPQPEFERAPTIPVQMPTPRRPPSDLPTFVPAPAEPAMDMPVPQHQTPAPAPQVLPPASPPSQSAYPVPLPIFDFRSEQEAWGGVAPKAPEQQQSRGMNGGAVEMSRSSSIRMPLINPFDDPVAPRITVTQPEGVPMPYPQHQEPIGPTEQIVMPLPPVHEVIPSRSPQTFPYAQGYLPADNDETRPLLSGSAPKNVSYLQPSNASNFMNVSQNGMPSSVAWPVQETTYGPRLHDLGWIEYRLPDGTVYYVHPTRRVAADLDLRNDTTLDIVTAQLAHQKDVPTGMELWLRQDVSATSDRRPGLHIVRFWINHKQRMVSLDQSAANGSAGRNPKAAAEDQLDIDYRYWSFMEAHPAHTALPANARIEATDVLTWSWTDRLLPSHGSIPAPFTQEECQELMGLLKSFEQGDNNLQTVVHTRIVARILLRVAYWRQKHFRPNKPLPSDVLNHELGPKSRRPFRRAFVDLIISCLCLGIPYIFFDRNRNYRVDEESGTRSAGPLFLVGACTCLVAAIVLSASVTFLSLPGLDNFARVASFVAILFASFSMASTLVALFRYKADMESPVSHIAGEGLLMLSRRSVVMSLPLVFLVYSIVAFLTGIVLYSFRGLTTDPLTNAVPFEEYTKWTVLGVLGGLAGMLTVSLLLLRR